MPTPADDAAHRGLSLDGGVSRPDIRLVTVNVKVDPWAGTAALILHSAASSVARESFRCATFSRT